MLSSRLISVIDKLYVYPFRNILSREMFGYGVCGATNMILAAVWYFIIYHYVVAERYVDIDFVVISPHKMSLIIVFTITFFTGFWLNRHVAFRATSERSGRQLLRYALSVIGAIVLNYVCMKFFVEHIGIWPTPSKIITTAVSTIYSFIAAKYFTFRKSI